MFIKAIYVKNIQSWKESIIYFTDKLNIIKGRNDVGKTALQLSLRIFTDTLSNDKLKSAMTYGETESEVKLYLSNRTILQALLKCDINNKGKRERFKIQYNILNWQENKILKQWDGSSPEIPQYLGLLSTSNTCINLTELERKIFVNTDHKENTEIVNLFTSLPFVDEKINYLKAKQNRIEDIQKKTEVAVDFYRSKIQQPTKPIWQLKGNLEDLKSIKEQMNLFKTIKDYISLIQTIKSITEYLQVVNIELYNIYKLQQSINTKNLQVINYMLKIDNERRYIENLIIYNRLSQNIDYFNQISNIRYLNKLVSSYIVDILSEQEVNNKITLLKDTTKKLFDFKLQENILNQLKDFINVKNTIKLKLVNKSNLDALHRDLQVYTYLTTFKDYIKTLQSLKDVNENINSIDNLKLIYNSLRNISLLKEFSNLISDSKLKTLTEEAIKDNLNNIETLKSNGSIIKSIEDFINTKIGKLQLEETLRKINMKIDSMPKCPTCNRPF